MEIRQGRVFCPDGVFRDMDIYIEDGRFSEYSRDGRVVDASGYYVIPGLIDLHVHGCRGADFSDGTVESLQIMGEYLARNGVTNFCPATVALPEEDVAKAFRSAVEYESVRRPECAFLRAVRMEGPFLSAEKAGAQSREHLKNPDVNMVHRLQREADGLLRYVDLAPELPGAIPFIKELFKQYRISLGHSSADYWTAMKALNEGASQITHLYNAMTGMHHRAAGMVGAAADEEICYVELIGDGVHVDAPVIRNTFKLMGADRMILVSDSMRAAGMGDGIWDFCGQKVRVNDGVATLGETGQLAGSTSTLMDVFRYTVRRAKVELEDAVKAVTVNPAKSIGIYDQYGSIEPGKIAHLVFLDENLELKAVWF